MNFKKVILNKSYGDWCVSTKAYFLYAERTNIKIYCYYFNYGTYDRLTREEAETNSIIQPFNYYFTEDQGEKKSRDQLDFSKAFRITKQYREDPILIQIVEELGDEASGLWANLKVVEIPDDMDYVIHDFDGMEMLHEDVHIY